MEIDNTIIAAIIGAVATIVATLIGILWSRKKKVTLPNSESILIRTHTVLSPELEDALALAELQSRREGKSITSTKHFFAAIARLKPNGLSDLITELNKVNAMPDPISEDIVQSPRNLTYERSFSGCVTESLDYLSREASNQNKVTVNDVFIDVSKFGRGSSVSRMREKGVEPDTIDSLVNKYGIEVKHHRR